MHIEKNIRNKYLTQTLIDEIKNILKKYEKMWTQIKYFMKSKNNNLKKK